MGTNRPGGISGKSGESISAPKRLELWQEARERERDERSRCEAGAFLYSRITFTPHTEHTVNCIRRSTVQQKHKNQCTNAVSVLQTDTDTLYTVPLGPLWMRCKGQI